MADQNKQKEQADEWAIILVIVLVCASVWAAWEFGRGYIVGPLFWLKLMEIKAISLAFDPKSLEVSAAGALDGLTLAEIRQYIERKNPWEVTFRELRVVLAAVGGYMRWFVLLVGAACVACVMFFMKGDGFKRQFPLSPPKRKKGELGFSFMSYQAQHWKVTTPSVMFDPDTETESNRPARTPLEFLWDNHIRFDAETGFDEEKKEEARIALARQIGPVWPGLDRADTYVRALVVLCVLNGTTHKDCRKMKERIAIIWSKTETREAAIKQTEEAIAPYLSSKKLKKAIKAVEAKHHFTTTFLMRLMEWARKQGGVFATAEITWLKGVDRALWYALNNLGRKAYHIEGAGPVAHYQAEVVWKGKLADPYVDEAVEGIAYYLDDQGIEDLDEFFCSDEEDDE